MQENSTCSTDFVHKTHSVNLTLQRTWSGTKDNRRTVWEWLFCLSRTWKLDPGLARKKTGQFGIICLALSLYFKRIKYCFLDSKKHSSKTRRFHLMTIAKDQGHRQICALNQSWWKRVQHQYEKTSSVKAFTALFFHLLGGNHDMHNAERL